MHVSSNRPVSEDEEKLMMYSPGSPFIMVAPVVTSWAVAGQRMVFLHTYLQTRVTLKAFPVATPKGRSSKFPWRGTSAVVGLIQLPHFGDMNDMLIFLIEIMI